MDDVNYSCRHSRVGGPDNRDKALRYFFALRFPTDSYRYKLGSDSYRMTTVHVEAYKTACCKITSMVGTLGPNFGKGSQSDGTRQAITNYLTMDCHVTSYVKPDTCRMKKNPADSNDLRQTNQRK